MAAHSAANSKMPATIPASPNSRALLIPFCDVYYYIMNVYRKTGNPEEALTAGIKYAMQQEGWASAARFVFISIIILHLNCS